MYDFRRSLFAGNLDASVNFRCQTSEKSSTSSSSSSLSSSCWHQRSLESGFTMFYFPSRLPSAPICSHVLRARACSPEVRQEVRQEGHAPMFRGHMDFCVGMALGISWQTVLTLYNVMPRCEKAVYIFYISFSYISHILIMSWVADIWLDLTGPDRTWGWNQGHSDPSWASPGVRCFAAQLVQPRQWAQLKLLYLGLGKVRDSPGTTCKYVRDNWLSISYHIYI